MPVSKMKTARLLAAAAIVALVATACSGPGNEPEQQGSDTVRIATASFANDTLDPAIESRGIVLNNLLPMWDTLLEMGEDGSIVPGVATSWEANEDATTWTFELRDDVEFHNGDMLTAADVKFSIERFIAPEAASTGSGPLRAVIESVEVVDDYTVVMHLSRPSVSLPYLLSPHENETGIIFPSKYMLEEGGPDFASQSALLEEAPIGSGPFRFVSRQRGDNIVYEAVEHHWRNTPTFTTLEYLLVPEAATQLAMLASGEADVVELAGDQIGEVEGQGFEVRRAPGSLGVSLQFTGTYRPAAADKPTADPRVREAISLAINRAEILETLLAGEGELPTTPWVTGTFSSDINPADWADWADDANAYDLDRARELLDEAGYPDGFSGINLFLYTRPGAPWAPAVGEIIAAQVAEIGVNLTIVPTDYGTYRDHYTNASDDDPYNAGDLTVFATSLRFAAGGALATYWLGDGGVVQLMKNADMDADIQQIDSIVDEADRIDLVRDVFETANESWLAPRLFDVNALWGVNAENVAPWTSFPGSPALGRVVETIGQD